MTDSALLYNEPGITLILILSSFITLLNIVGCMFDKLFHGGLLGQIFLGVAWGIPGTKWLSLYLQEAIVDLGYLGLILLVYEGGLGSNFRVMKSNLLLSSLIALTGVVTTIGISFILMGIADASPLQSFAAGAALSSTSLGTTFTILKSSGLISSHIGVIIASAAMLDDVSGLIMAQIISKLGTSEVEFSAVTVIRPVFVSIAFAIGVPFICFLVVKPLANKWRVFYTKWPLKGFSNIQMSALLHTAILIGFVAASSYAGTSNLFGAYLAGACISWYDSEIKSGLPLSSKLVSNKESDRSDIENGFICSGDALTCPPKSNSTHMARKCEEDLSITRFPKDIECPAPALLKNTNTNENLSDQVNSKTEGSKTTVSAIEEGQYIFGDVVTGACTWHAFYEKPVSAILKPFFFSSIGFSIPISQMFKGSLVWRGLVYSIMMTLAKLLCGVWLLRLSIDRNDLYVNDNQNILRRIPKLKSFNSALVVGSAMVARGEIGFLIAAIAQNRGIFSPDQFLIVMWSIIICTMIGPIAVGILVRKVSRQQISKRDDS